jgi:hypothetical protein
MSATIAAEISRQDLRDVDTPPVASITCVKHLASYNWIETPTPTIVVPGSPPLWSAPEAPQQLKQDSGLIYIAQNAARHPESPVEPLFRALSIADPSFDIRTVDIVTDRNNIRKLHSFINRSLTKYGLEAFTIKIEVTKNTAIFCRQETATHEYIQPHEFKGYGHEFEKVYTTNQISGGTGHHRIISYRFSDLHFVVRHETDGYVDDGIKEAASRGKDPKKDELSAMVESLSLHSASVPQKATACPTKLKVKEGGQVVPLESTLEIKTRVFHKQLLVQEISPQLWISQTPKLVRAYHRRGIFQRPEVEDIATEIKSWEKANQGDLRKLAALIKRILSVVKGCGGKAIVIYDDRRDKLLIYKDDGRKMLPEDLYAIWDDNGKFKVETRDDDCTKPESSAKGILGDGAKAEGKVTTSGPRHTKGKHKHTAKADNVERSGKGEEPGQAARGNE